MQSTGTTPVLNALSQLPTPACVEWSGKLTPDGYGRHRHIYGLVRGPIPRGLVLDHLCSNRKCVNPDHLEPVTQRLNVQRARMRSGGLRSGLGWPAHDGSVA